MPATATSLPESIIVREMQLADAAAVSELTTQLGYARSADEVAEWLARAKTERAEQAAFVATLDSELDDEIANEIVGWIEVSIERRLQSPPFGMIGGLVVSDRVRSRGIGRLLCHRAEQWTWEQGLDTLRVTSRITREGARRFYLRDGYREVKTSLVFEKQCPSKNKSALNTPFRADLP
jgi:GNAT superfamily N-acetyltransferase